MAIQQYAVKKVKVSDIALDKANPNKMSDEQLEALRYSLKKFGQLKPIIIDQTMTVCDGEHQLRAYLAENVEDVQVIQVECTPAERRLIRQTMNKLHGLHQKDLDIEEFKALVEENQLGELSQLLAKDETELLKLMEGEDEFDPNKTDDQMDTYLHGTIKQIVLYFDNDSYDQALEMFETLMKKFEVESNTEVVLRLIEHYENNKDTSKAD